MSASVADVLALVAAAPEGSDVRPLARLLAQQLAAEDMPRESLLVLAAAALALLPDREVEVLSADELHRRGRLTVRLGLDDLSAFEAALVAGALLGQLTPVQREAVLALLPQAPVDTVARRRVMAAHWLALPRADRQVFLAWAEEALAA